jgi:hypothetical protein
MIGLLLAMYPARWRRRYGDEFRAVLESRPLGPFDVADILLGALDARFTRFRLVDVTGPDGGHVMLLRLGGLGAIGGGILWFFGVAGLSSGLLPETLWLAMGILGNLGILVALAGLSAFQAHRNAVLAWAAFAIPGIGTLLSLAGFAGFAITSSDAPLVGPLSAWGLWFLGLLATMIGSLLFAVATLRAAVLSARAAMALAVSSAFVIAVVAMGFGTDGPTPVGVAVTFLSMASFAASWVALGLTALRRGPIRAIAPA